MSVVKCRSIGSALNLFQREIMKKKFERDAKRGRKAAKMHSLTVRVNEEDFSLLKYCSEGCQLATVDEMASRLISISLDVVRKHKHGKPLIFIPSEKMN
jgi:hypothetical protein